MMETFFDWANASDAHIDENPNRKIDAYNLKWRLDTISKGTVSYTHLTLPTNSRV